MVQSVVIITIAGGGGHLEAAKAKQYQLKLANPQTKVIEIDILIDWINKRFGRYYLGMWNNSQRRGNINNLEFLITCQPIAEKLFWLVFFFRMLRCLYKHDVSYVVDTQPIGTSALLSAIRLYNLLTKKQVYLEKIITELPTEWVTHFFRPIKNLSVEKRKLLKVVALKPLLKDNQTEASFWQEHCGLSEQNILYSTPPLRPNFLQYQDKVKDFKPLKLQIKIYNEEELQLFKDCLEKGKSSYRFLDDHLEITIRAEDKVSLVMLGSKPQESATLHYVQNFLEICSNNVSNQRQDLLFVCCSKGSCEGISVLQKQIAQAIKGYTAYPTQLTVIPMSFQNDDVLAPLFFRSDATFTRSGGLTSMELLSVCHGQIWIHSENSSAQFAKSPMPIWERGNAQYLQEKKGAQLVSPDLFFSVCTPYFKMGS